MTYYAVAKGKMIGIFFSWDDCKICVNGYKGAIYKKVYTLKEAESFIKQHMTCHSENIPESTLLPNKDNLTFEPDYYVYTDGACSNNGKINAKAGIGVFFGKDDIRNISEKIEGKQTNNVAELTAIIKTYSIIENDIINGKNIIIVSDSEYAIRCMTSYGEKCSKDNWNKNIPNKELIQSGYEMFKDKPNIQFKHIKAHTNNNDIHSLGNDYADKLANMAIGLDSCPYAN